MDGRLMQVKSYTANTNYETINQKTLIKNYKCFY